tara:strand:+ start:8126 stop:14650 length:6525 start_codon:yes stop_codon:yes gene_type:complete
MVQYRSPYPNFYSDKTGSYMSIGAIVPSLVDSYSTDVGSSITGEGNGGLDPSYNYRNFLYCDGEQYDIRKYPLLYEKIGNDYNLTTEATSNNAIRSEVSGAPGTVYRTFVDNGNVYAEIHSEPIPNSTEYTRVVPNGAQLTFELLNDYPTANGQVVQGTQYLLEYSETFQSLASQADTHVFRLLINYDPDNNTGGSPGGTVNWVITSITLIQTADLNYPLVLPETNYGTVPALDPGTYDPLTGQGYPTGYSQYANANNDTPAFSWANLSGLPVGVIVDTYEILIEDLSTDVRTNWHVQNIPNTFTGFSVNQQMPAGVVLQQNTVEQSSIGSAPEWVNNGYSGPQPPTGEKHIYRFHVQATLNNSQQICTYQDFTAGAGSLIPLYNRNPQLTQNFNVTGGNSGIVDTSLDVIIGDLTNQPRIKIRKAFSISDLPQVLGKFRVPDYRDRKLIGFGQGVNGAGTPLVGDRITMNVGDVGGQWFIGTDTIEDPVEFYEISDVLTTGYANVTTLVQPYLTGEKKYTVGPIQDYIFARPPSHLHNLLHSEPDDVTEANAEGVDTFTTGYGKVKGYIENFIPNLPSGETLGHSHGLLGYRPLSPKTSTFGNVEGIGLKEQTNALPDKTWDVTDAELVWTLNGTALLNWGNGVGEVGGFVSPGSGSQYLAFGSPGSTTFATHQATRDASFTLNVEGYSKFFALGIAGNDINGGERCDDVGDNLRIRFTGAGSAPTSTWYELMESAGSYNINNNSVGFGAYDASYQVWKNREIDIPAIYRDAAEQPLTIEIQQTSDSNVSGGDPIGEYRSANNISGTLNTPVGTTFHPNGYDAYGLAKIGLRAGEDGNWDGCYNYKITEPGSLPIVSAAAQNGVLTIIFTANHTFEIGDNIILSNTQTSLDGAYTILEANFTLASFQCLCDETQSAGFGSVRLASGYFTEVPVTPTPRVWVVDDNTVIGGKEIIVTTPGTGEERFINTYDSGTANIAANAGGENITSYTMRIAGGGGGGGGSSGSGGNGFDSSVTLTVDGNPYTITAGGGQGGQAGTNGGQGGQGGTWTIPTEIFTDPRFTFNITSNGDNGTTGGIGNGAVPAGGLPPIAGWNDRGNGGAGSYDEFLSTGSATQTWSTSTTSWTQVYGPAYSAGNNYVELTGQSTGSWVTTWPCSIQISPVRTAEIKTTAVNSPNGLGQQNLWKVPPTFTAGLNWDLGAGTQIQGSTIFGQTGDESWTTVYGPGANFTAQNFMETCSNPNGLVIDPGNPNPQNKSGLMGYHFYYKGVLRAVNPYGRNGPTYENGLWNYWGCYRFKGGTQLAGTSDIAVEFIGGSGDLKVTGTGFAQVDFRFEWLDGGSNGYALGTVSWQIGGQTVSFTQNQGQTSGVDDTTHVNIAVTANTIYPCTITGMNAAGFDVIPSPPAFPGLCFKDGDGNDCNAKVEIVAINNQPQTRYEIEVQQMQFPTYEHSPTQRFDLCEVSSITGAYVNSFNSTSEMNWVCDVSEQQLQGGGGGGTYTYYYNGASVGSNADGAQIVTGNTAGSFRYSKGVSAGTNLWEIRVEELITTGTNVTTGSIDVNDIVGVPDEEIASISYVDFDISGGAGGNGPANGIGGCVGYGGGTGSPGRRVTGRLLNFNGVLDWTIGQQGDPGVNQQVGSVGEPSANGGSGANGANGGTSGSGAWGNGGSGGGGGGCTSLNVGFGQAIAAAGGGGGGGGSGGGWNGGGITDPCWTGGAGLGPTSGLYEANLFTFNPGGSGGSKGCTSGGGGGGGGGAGPTGGGNGGAGGVAGAGHVNTGSGSGGNAGRSAISTTYVTSPSESSGSTGGGYVTLTATFEEEGFNASGGGGGGGAALNIAMQPLTTSDDISTSFFIEVGDGGSGGAGNQGAAIQNGNPGRVEIGCYGRLPGDDDVVGISAPSGRYYEVPNFPDGNYDIANAGAPFTGAAANIWHSASEALDVVGSVGDNFGLATNISNGMANRHIRYSGLGSRFLQIGPLNLLNADKITFGVIKGNNSNGGEAPEEAIDCYFKVSLDATSETVLQAVADPQNVGTSGWANYSIDIDEESDARINGIYLIIRQTRPDGSGDNPNEQGGSVNDNWGLALFGVRYATYTERIFVPTLNASIPGNDGDCGPEDGIDEIRRVVTARDSNIRFTDGTLTLSTSTPISVAGTASVQDSLSLVTKYHRSKYLIKAM